VNPIRVTAVGCRRDLAAFVGLPYGLHAGDRCWAPPLRRDVRAMLSPRRNPFFEHAEAAYFLARDGARVVGRIAAIHNRRHSEVHEDATGFFGFFECRDDAEAAGALFEAAAGWLRARGLRVMRGPASFSTNDEAGLLVDGFETPAVLMTPHNPRCYVRLVEGAGFAAVKDLLAYQSTSDHLPERLVDGARILEKRYGVTTRILDMRRFEAEIVLVRDLYNAAWEKNWGFVPLTEREIGHLARRLRPIVVPELVVFAEREGQSIGVGVALPDLNVALRANPSGRLFPGILKVLRASRGITRLRVLMLGTSPEWRSKGIDALLYKRIWEEGYRKGFRWAEAGWILEDNHAMRNGLERMGFEVYKTYRLYERDL
jgi:GNAT superfamily N-acetyltransferase